MGFEVYANHYEGEICIAGYWLMPLDRNEAPVYFEAREDGPQFCKSVVSVKDIKRFDQILPDEFVRIVLAAGVDKVLTAAREYYERYGCGK